MSPQSTLLFAAAVLAGGVLIAPRVFAQPAQMPSSPSREQGMMDGHEMMGRNSMPGMSGMMSQMNRMAENCNRMMESMNTGHGSDGQNGNGQPAAPRR